jgi:hypothetical protein
LPGKPFTGWQNTGAGGSKHSRSNPTAIFHHDQVGFLPGLERTGGQNRYENENPIYFHGIFLDEE